MAKIISILFSLACLLAIVDSDQFKRLSSDTNKAIREKCLKNNIDSIQCRSLIESLTSICDDDDECVMKYINQRKRDQRSSKEELQRVCDEEDLDDEECEILKLVCDNDIECIYEALEA